MMFSIYFETIDVSSHNVTDIKHGKNINNPDNTISLIYRKIVTRSAQSVNKDTKVNTRPNSLVIG